MEFISAGNGLHLFNALDTLLAHANQRKVMPNETNPSGSAISLNIFNSLGGIENNKKENNAHYYKPRVINLYPLTENHYMIAVAFLGSSGNDVSLRAVINLTATLNNGSFTFAIPLSFYTRNWKTKQVGLITYHYQENINVQRAEKFDRNNKRIASKLGLQPEKFDFYLSDNYQGILHLLGYEFDSESTGNTTEGYGPDFGNIFSIMHNEDFSHDVFHYYAAKIRKHERNGAAEEGVAYSWGNA